MSWLPSPPAQPHHAGTGLFATVSSDMFIAVIIMTSCCHAIVPAFVTRVTVWQSSTWPRVACGECPLHSWYSGSQPGAAHSSPLVWPQLIYNILSLQDTCHSSYWICNQSIHRDCVMWSSVLTVTGQWAEAEDTCSPGQPHQSARMERLKNLHTLHHTIHVTRYMLHVTCYTLHDTSHCFLFCCGVESSLTSKHSVSYLYSSFIQLRWVITFHLWKRKYINCTLAVYWEIAQFKMSPICYERAGC